MWNRANQNGSGVKSAGNKNAVLTRKSIPMNCL